MVSTKLEFTGSEFFDILREYQDRVKEGVFKKTVPYDIWRKLKLARGTVKFDFIEDYQLGEILYDEGHSYSEYFTEDGLIKFLYDKWVEEEKNMTATNEATLATKVSGVCYGNANANANAIEISNDIKSNNGCLNGSSIVWDCDDGTTLQKKTWTSGYANYANRNRDRDRDIENLNEKIDDIIASLEDKVNCSDFCRSNDRLDCLEVKTSILDNDNCDSKATLNCLAATSNDFRLRIDEATNTLNELTQVVLGLQTELATKEDKKEITTGKNKENKRMKNFNFDFGPCTNDNVRMSMYGLAVKNADGTYVSFNPATREIIDVDILNFDGGKYMYKMPVAIKDVAVGDVIIHQRKPMFVEGFTELGGVMAVDPVAGERKEILPTKNMFNFNFVTKVVSLFNMCGTVTPTTEQPFGNMLPFMLMGEEGGDIDPMMLMFMMNQNGGANTSVFGNPMMMYFLMKDKGDIDPMMFMFMGQSQTSCQCNCDGTHNA